jgi:butyryl-CoA dehydrogenase
MNEERELIKKIAADFTEQEVKPFIAEMEENHTYPRQLLRRMGELNFQGLIFPPEVGGIGPDWITAGIVAEEIAKESNLVSILLALNTAICAETIHKLGTPEQIDRWVRPAIKGDVNLALCLTEPNGIFNFSENQTKAVLDGDSWIVNGSKIFTTNAGNADCYIVECLTDEPDPATMYGVSYILVPADTPGFEAGHIENKVGWPGSSTGNTYFKNCKVPKENLLGPLHTVFPIIYANLEDEFIMFGAACLGGAVGVFEKTLQFTKERIQLGKSLFDTNQSVRQKLAQMYTEIESVRGLVYMTLAMKDKGISTFKQSFMCKIKGAAVFESVSSQCVVLHGGLGAVIDTGIERYYRDAKVNFLAGGSNDTLVDGLGSLL